MWSTRRCEAGNRHSVVEVKNQLQERRVITWRSNFRMVGRQKWWVDQQQEVVLRKYERETARKGVLCQKCCSPVLTDGPCEWTRLAQEGNLL
ncbi:hypothetical protein HO173_012447 [Letharia columbiana]|uniref:Uncharacterized protein n=1 Tax=Letharia columbiana TaxID=112416 RepID=A0A8H6CNE4_9LECA|nr:uncharacterized protein HO173_012447 [Letharia columbiana]KAF6226617.1 hypothetical protein HO173_012447 [Letharia columbiana]